MWLVRTGDEGHFQVAKDLPLVQRFLQHEPPTLSRTIVNKKLSKHVSSLLRFNKSPQVTASQQVALLAPHGSPLPRRCAVQAFETAHFHRPPFLQGLHQSPGDGECFGVADRPLTTPRPMGSISGVSRRELGNPQKI